MPIGNNFSGSRLLQGRARRPYAFIYVVNPITKQRTSRIRCLVDTGSDWTILPARTLSQIGLIPGPNGSSTTIKMAGGHLQTLQSIQNVMLEIESYYLTTEIAVSTTRGFTPILGRADLVSTFDIAFDDDRWYWD